MSVFAPWVPMCGPLWASGLLTITERYKRGYKTMRTYWGGVCTFRASTVIAVMILPLVTLIKPAFAIFFGITMAVQCFACGNIGMRMATTANERGHRLRHRRGADLLHPRAGASRRHHRLGCRRRQRVGRPLQKQKGYGCVTSINGIPHLSSATRENRAELKRSALFSPRYP